MHGVWALLFLLHSVFVFQSVNTLTLWLYWLIEFIASSLWQPKGQSLHSTIFIRKEKRIHELIFPLLSWLAVLLLGVMYTQNYGDNSDDELAEDGSHAYSS